MTGHRRRSLRSEIILLMSISKPVIRELHYSTTNTYLIEGTYGTILLDTGWAGTLPDFQKALKEQGCSPEKIGAIIISHFHPDHMGIAEEISLLGPTIVVFDVQQSFLHASDAVFYKEKAGSFLPIDDARIEQVPLSDSRSFLQRFGIDGEIFHTPGHTDDSISLWLDEGILFVGDLNPLYELPLHQGTQIGESWEKLLALHPKRIYYGHAKTAVLDEKAETPLPEETDQYALVERIMHYLDKGYSFDRIQKKTGARSELVEDVARMYLTHQNIGVQGILDRIEIKGR